MSEKKQRRKKPKAEIRYEIQLYWSKEDDAFIAEVPELPGCAADGATYQDALSNAEVVIREWIETARELGPPIPKPRRRLAHTGGNGRPAPAEPRTPCSVRDSL